MITIAVAAVLACVTVLAIMVTAGMIKSNDVFYIILVPVTVAGIIFLALALVMYIKVSPAVLVCILVGVMLGVTTVLVTQKKCPQSEERGSPATSPSPLPQAPQLNPNVHSEYETIAQSACTSMAIKGGHEAGHLQSEESVIPLPNRVMCSVAFKLSIILIHKQAKKVGHALELFMFTKAVQSASLAQPNIHP